MQATMQSKAIEAPIGWDQVARDKAILDLIADGYEYWIIDQDVFRHQDGGTRWVSKLAPWRAMGRRLAERGIA